ncbi:hypothetical protein EDB85DRAFT_839115 [Lactarius pseudohatsudake]|nr:hypothetical protein EDB85DRAFT_839115 [Lactarius pseudohatsudake]
MISLGYTEYVTQAGDLGYVLTLTTASLYGPKHVKASHTNMPICELPSLKLLFGNPIVLLKYLITSFTSREREAAAASQNRIKSGMGYFAEQSTKPQTLGFSLADSPVGLPARVCEKLVTSRGQTRIRGPTTKDRSSDVGLDLFVRTRRTRSVHQDLLRARTLGRIDQFPQDDRSGPSVLPQGAHPVTQS